MDLQIPDWLDERFLTNVLRDEGLMGEIVHVLSFNVEPALGPGNNFTSYMYRVHVVFATGNLDTNKTVSLMVKVPMVEGFLKDLTEEHNFFGKEPKIYNELLPSLSKLAFCEFGPRTLKCPVKNVLVMTDLKAEGYFLCDKTKQLDFFHSKAVLVKLAKFHAATVVCLNNSNELVRDVGVDHFYAEGSSIGQMVGHSLKYMAKTITVDKRYAKFADFFLHRYDQIWPSCIQLAKPKTDGGFNVLNHGDLWVNNVLFKYSSSGEVADVKFIDYQVSRIGSPANDLIYFIWSSTDEEVRAKRQQELYNIYLTTLNKTLASLGSEERLSEQELREDVVRAVDFVIMTVLHNVPIMMARPEDTPDYAKMTDEDYETEKFNKIFTNKIYHKYLPNYIKQITECFLNTKCLLSQNT